MWPAGGHCDGRRSRSIHSLADSARREWLLWRHQVGRSAPGRSLPQLLRRPSRRPPAPSAAPGDTRGIDRARVLISREGKCICDGRPRLELNRRFTVVVAGAASVLFAVSAHAGPCTTAIAQFERAVRQSANNPDAGPMAPQSIGAQLNRQPTPGSMKRAEERARASFDAVMARAKRLDARGDRTGCRRALTAAKRMYNL